MTLIWNVSKGIWNISLVPRAGPPFFCKDAQHKLGPLSSTKYDLGYWKKIIKNWLSSPPPPRNRSFEIFPFLSIHFLHIGMQDEKHTGGCCVPPPLFYFASNTYVQSNPKKLHATCMPQLKLSLSLRTLVETSTYHTRFIFQLLRAAWLENIFISHLS
jgi:hypothetical protein